ncbi:redoxin family protein [Aliamphritea hakodatensis]|uniref:redoxin family protein n=1 Tax=Aliamphritea hakodatensis TaxID=2895352 RepID=UPI0022FD4B68|nr:redoxin domain-containing protein [Aliamphritea hakodatensis]
MPAILNPKTLLKKYWKDIALILAVFIGITAWQERNLLADNQPADNFELPILQSSESSPLFTPGKQTLVYFFAPWCSICKLSIGNLSAVSGEVDAVAVALDYTSASEVSEFIGEQEVQVPVLMGNQRVSNAYKISAFPTYYLIDTDGTIAEKSMGYSSSLGLRWRTL